MEDPFFSSEPDARPSRDEEQDEEEGDEEEFDVTQLKLDRDGEPVRVIADNDS